MRKGEMFRYWYQFGFGRYELLRYGLPASVVLVSAIAVTAVSVPVIRTIFLGDRDGFRSRDTVIVT